MKSLKQMAAKTVLCLSAVSGFGISSVAQQSAQGGASKLSFEVASIRLSSEGSGLTTVSPSGAVEFTAKHANLAYLIQIAYGIENYQIAGRPNWLGTQFYDVAAKPEGETGLTSEQLKPFLQQLLEQRFHLVTHREKKELKGYALMTAKGGPKLQTATGPLSTQGVVWQNGLRGQGISIGTFVQMLSWVTGRPVIDSSGVEGNYDISISFAPVDGGDSALPSVFTVLQEQLGLRLEAQTVPAEMLVIDHVERIPTEN